MTQKQIRAELKALRPRLKKWDITRANIKCDEEHGMCYAEPATLTRFLNGEMTSTFAYELYSCLKQVVEEREAKEREIAERIAAYHARKSAKAAMSLPVTQHQFAEGASI
jgi:hypothetical protein